MFLCGCCRGFLIVLRCFLGVFEGFLCVLCFLIFFCFSTFFDVF